MKVQINGEAAIVTEGLNVSELLAERKVQMPDMVSVELNGDILKKDDFRRTRIQEGDRVEFLYFMGGGR